MKIFGFNISWRPLIAVCIFALILIILLVTYGVSDPEFNQMLETPAKDMTVGHLTWLIVIAGMLFGRH